eukprot:TRINITY_DN1923_c0_g3_i1.p1 TRINITY_DN1923_c0_g3~~TRINITY_DN1923_c0_g3_i1.p1  ORF type:complete len:272 (+),score=71.62 TRINITY_DN1923_c0_g3_i1:139-954(+)
MANWVPVAAGGVCGGVEAVLTYPAEYAKTQLQLLPAARKGSMVEALRRTKAREGVRGWYRGCAVVVCGGVPKHGLRFGVHDCTCEAVGSFGGGLLGGLAASFGAIIPQETVKTTLIKNPTVYRGGAHCAAALVRAEGVRGLYRGVAATASKNALNTAIRFPAQRFFKGCFPHTDHGAAAAAQHGAAGVLAGWTSVVATQPFDTIKTKQQGTSPGGARLPLARAVSETWRGGGVRGFYAGTVPRLLRVAPENAILFAIYPSVRDALAAAAGA